MEPTEIYLYDCICGEDAGEVIQKIRGAGTGPIDLHVNSPGGDVFAGYAIYNALLAHVGGVTVYIDGLAASIASYIAMAGKKIFMAENAMLMVHNPTQFIGGDAGDMRRAAELLDKITSSLTDAYVRRTKLPREKVTEMLDAETWLTPDMAKAMGFIDDIKPALQMAAHFDISKFRNPPEKLNKTIMNLKNITAFLCTALPGQVTLTETSPVAEIESGIKLLGTQRDSFKTQVLNLIQAAGAAIMAALPGNVTFTDASSQTDVENGIKLLVTDRDGFKSQISAMTKSIVALVTAALPGKVTLTEASPLSEIENAFKLLVGDRDGLSVQVTNLTTERDRAKKHLGLLEDFAKAQGLNVSGIDPDKAPVPPAPPQKNATVAEWTTKMAAAKTPEARAKVSAEFEAAVKAGTVSTVS